MYEDRAATVAELTAAIRSSGLSQTAFATSLGTSASRLSTYLAGQVAPSAPAYLRALRLGRGLAEAAASGWLSAPAVAAATAKALASDDESWAFPLLLQGRDHLRQLIVHRPDIASAWEAAPRCERAGGELERQRITHLLDRLGVRLRRRGMVLEEARAVARKRDCRRSG